MNSVPYNELNSTYAADRKYNEWGSNMFPQRFEHVIDLDFSGNLGIIGEK
jgi:hypothetical protein